MTKLSQIALIMEMINAAETNIKNVKQLINDFIGTDNKTQLKQQYTKAAANLKTSINDSGKVIEGVFNGSDMIGPDGREYHIQANYASKSKLVCGDNMKLVVTSNGDFRFKQTAQVERKRVIGPLVLQEGQYKVIANSKVYKVLHASITYYRAEPGDQVVLLVPDRQDSEWGAVENIIPKIEAELKAEEEILAEAQKNNPKTEDSGESIIISDTDELDNLTENPKIDLSKEKTPRKPRKKTK